MKIELTEKEAEVLMVLLSSAVEETDVCGGDNLDRVEGLEDPVVFAWDLLRKIQGSVASFVRDA